jgi:hypothetical protein
MVYEKLSEAELDQYLLISYLPMRKDKINFSDKDTFVSLIVAKIIQLKIEEDFGENLILFAKKDTPWLDDLSLLVSKVFCLEMKIVKMAALKTYHDTTE